MAEQIVSDLLMMFIDDSGNPIEGESSTQIDLKPSAMSRGFQQGAMFEVESFQFKAGLDPDDDDTVKQRKEDEARRKDLKALHGAFRAMYGNVGAKGAPPLPELPARTTPAGSYAKWRQGGDTTYPVDISPVEFSRSLDKASSTLLDNCIHRKVYRSASLIKRKAAGGPLSGEVFLRFDFTKVLMTRVEWENEEPIKEKCQFVSRAVTIHYLPQLPDGTLGAPLQAFWSMSPKLKPVNLRG